MTIDEIKTHKYIWAYMYGKPFGKDWTDVLVRIDVSKLHFYKNQFDYIWGYPGPDMNTYYLKDYGKTWCFYHKEMPEVPVHELDQKYADEEMN